MFKQWNAKNRMKIFILQRDIFRIQRGKTPTGLHRQGEKLSLSDKEPKHSKQLVKLNKTGRFPAA